MFAILSALALPSGIAYSLFVLGLLAALSTRTRRMSWWLMTGSGAVVIVFSSGMVAAALMSPLEYRYPAIDYSRAFPEANKIVVLTGYAPDDL